MSYQTAAQNAGCSIASIKGTGLCTEDVRTQALSETAQALDELEKACESLSICIQTLEEALHPVRRPTPCQDSCEQPCVPVPARSPITEKINAITDFVRSKSTQIIVLGDSLSV